MNIARKVIGTKNLFFREGAAVSVPAAGTGSVAGPASATNKPDVTDPLYQNIGPVKFTVSQTGKTEDYMSPSPGAYTLEDEIPLSRGQTLKGKLEKVSNLSMALRDSASAIPSTGVGGVYNPLSSAPNIRGWLHIEEYDQNDVLVNTIERWVSMRASGDTNLDDKASETPIEAKVLQSTLNVGNLS